MIWCVLRSKSDLRVVFNEYTSTMKSDENACHWLEIDALVNLLVVRWSRQSEAHVVTNDGHLGLCLERVSVGEEAIKHRGVRNGNCTRRVWDDYNDVSSVDATFLSRSEAREKPFLTLRCWSNESEFCFSKKRCSYADAGKADSVLNGSRLQTGALGTLKRAAFLRVFYEEWKKKMGIGDEIVAPKLFRFLGSCYTCLEDSKEFGSVQDFLYKDVFLYPIPISVSWEMNRDNDVDVTLTGIRTGPIHRNFTSWQREWNQFSIDDLSTVYVASSGWFVQKSIVRSIAQKDEFQRNLSKRDDALACIDWIDQSDNIGSTDNITNIIQLPLPMRLFSSWQTELSVRAGWRSVNHGAVNPYLVGWGLPNWKRDWDEGGIRATALRLKVIDVMKAWTWIEGLWKMLDNDVDPYENYGNMV